jgi:FMNH2-dependent dimethyl sulfone monooxygenase
MHPHQRDRSEVNPALGRRKLKLGTFQTNLDSGCVMSDLDGRLEISWPNTVTLAQLADAMNFEALVPVARWRGFGGATDPQGPGFETFTWAAGIAGATHNAGVISTSHVALNHPIVAAKQSTVIDHISGGRYTLNVVNGWNYPEMDMFGVSLLEHEDRYACAEEWVTIVKRLWTEDERFDFDGRFYQIKGRLSAAEADPVAASGHHECRRVGTRPAFRLQALRSRLHQSAHPRHRHQHRACRELQNAGARDLRPRG